MGIDTTQLDDLSLDEQRCLTEYFLHKECGYTYDADGFIGALTQAEKRRLWRGRGLWMEYCDPEHSCDGAHSQTSDEITGKARSAGKLSQDTVQKFEQYKRQKGMA